MTLTFEPEAHVYRFNGQVVPSVTQVLSVLGTYNGINPRVLERVAVLGQFVHLACELNDRDDLDEASVDPAIAPYLHAWRRFSAETGARWEAIEQPLYHEGLRYAGTPDRIGSINGKPAVVDIKRVASVQPMTGLQLAGYAAAWVFASNVLKRYSVQLRADGTYRLQEYTGRNDLSVFMACLSVWNWKESNK